MVAKPSSPHEPMTLDEWAELDDDDDNPCELVDGYLVESEVPSVPHEIVVAWLVQRLRNWGEPRQIVAFASGVKFGVAPRRGRLPDVSVFLPDRTPLLPRRGAVRVPPFIAIEVVTPTTRDEKRDRVDKLGEYAAFGVAYYWLVDPAFRTIEVLQLVGDRYQHAAVSPDEGVFAPPGCEGLALDVSALWAEIDRVAEPDED